MVSEAAPEAPGYLYLDGVPGRTPGRSGEPYFAYDPQGMWRFSEDDGWQAVEAAAVALHYALIKNVFRGLDYAQLVRTVPEFVATAGQNSEAAASPRDLEEILKLTDRVPELNRFLYLFDCQRLVGAIQECCKEIVQIVGEFYRTLNLEPFFFPVLKHEDGLRYSSSPVVAKLFAFLSFVFIRMHSLLDYTVKIAIEAENLRTDFTTYPRMSSLAVQYGDRKRVSFNKAAGTLFEDCSFLVSVETLRNHIIHNGLLDDVPKAYEVTKDGLPVEKYVLIPDMVDGRFERFRNRNLFYGRGDKINLRLPQMVFEFMGRQEATLWKVTEGLEARAL